MTGFSNHTDLHKQNGKQLNSSKFLLLGTYI